MSESEVKTNIVSDPENEVVDQKAYKQVAADMHKYKSELKQYKEQLAAIKADKEAAEKQSLYEQEKWKELFQKNEASLKQIQAERDQERNKFLTSHKINNVVQELGGFKKPEYVKFIDTTKVEMDEDGNILAESVKAEVERIKKEYPELIKTSSVQPLPSKASSGFVQKPVSQMTAAELAQKRRELLQKG